MTSVGGGGAQRTTLWISLCAASALLLTACPPPTAPAPVDRTETGAFGPADVEREILDRVNALRREGGSAPLVQDPTLTQLARGHVEAMAAGRVPFGHTGYQKRLAAAALAVGGRRGAENVALQRQLPRSVPVAVVGRWLTNDAHRQNLLGRYQYVGVAAALDRDGRWYVVWIVAASQPEQADFREVPR